MKSSSSDARRGAQRPRLNVCVGDVSYTEFDDARDLFESLGVSMFPWQDEVFRQWAARDGEGKASYITCGLDVPRQNGKNFVIELYELYCIAVCGWHVLHTAHRVKTAKKSFQRLARYFENDGNPELKAMVERIRRTNGEEAVYLKNGGCVEFIARTNGTARGFDDIQLVIFDEAQELTDAQFDAIMYTLAASATGERQIIYTGTPPNEKAPGTVFPRTRSSVLTGEVRRSNWNSWSVDGCPPRTASFSDVVDDVYSTNPSMGYLLDEDFTESEFAGASIEGFAHERLGWWRPVGSIDALIDAESWDALAVDAAPTDEQIEKMACAVKFAPDGSRGTLAVACKLEGGKSYVEVMESRSLSGGTSWFSDWIAARSGRLAGAVIDGRVGAPSVVQRLSESRFPKRALKVPTSSVVAASVSMLVDAVKSKTVLHYPQPALDAAMTKCSRRSIGSDGFGFADTDEGDSTMAEACALALYEVMTTKRRPGKGCRML